MLFKRSVHIGEDSYSKYKHEDNVI